MPDSDADERATSSLGQLGTVHGQVRRAAVDVTTLIDKPVPLAALSGDWLTAAGFPVGQRFVAECDRHGVITLVATDDRSLWGATLTALQRRERG